MHKPVAVISAMPLELAPLVASRPRQKVEGIDVYELPSAVVLVGGIGEQCARRTAEFAVKYATPEFLVNAGLAGGISPQLKVGDVGQVREVVEVPGGNRYPTGGGEWLLVTGAVVSGPEAKQSLHQKYGADVVDMEAAAVAQVAAEHGLKLAILKSISDVADFVLPPLGQFVERDGKFAMRRFLAYVAIRPNWWRPVMRLGQNSKLASRNLSEALQHLIEKCANVENRENRRPA